MAYGPELFDIADVFGEATGVTVVGQTIEMNAVAGNTNIFFNDAMTIDTSKTYKASFTVSGLAEGLVYPTRPFTVVDSPAAADGDYSFERVGDLGYGMIYRSSSAPSNTMVLSNISLKEVLPDTTTTIEVEWIDSISAAATGNKIYRDDVEIADVANGIQTYPDDTAETGTEYKYEVQAYSATDETTQEVLGVNVQYITTA